MVYFDTCLHHSQHSTTTGHKKLFNIQTPKRLIISLLGLLKIGQLFTLCSTTHKVNDMNTKKNTTCYHGKPIERTDHPHIVKVQGVASGEPIILNTRLMVRTIIEQYQLGSSIEDILWDFPQLSSAQIHDALAYYHDHKQDMDILLNQATYEYWQPILAEKFQHHAQAIS